MVKILVTLGAIQLVVLAFMKATGDSNKEFDDDIARMARIEKWRQDNEKRRYNQINHKNRATGVILLNRN